VGGSTWLFPFGTALVIGSAQPGVAGDQPHLGLFVPSFRCAPGCVLTGGEDDGDDRVEWLTAKLPDPPVAGSTLELAAEDLAVGAWTGGQFVAEEIHPASWGEVTVSEVDTDGVHGTVNASLVLLNLTVQGEWSFVAGQCQLGPGHEEPWLPDAGVADAGPDAAQPSDASAADARPLDAAPPDAGPPPDCVLSSPVTVVASDAGLLGRRAIGTAFDSAGELNAVFPDLTADALRHAHLEPGGWTVSTIDTTGDLQDSVALAAGSAGRLEALYGTYAGSDYAVRTASKPGASWTTAALSSGGPGGLVIDTAGTRHASLYDDGVVYANDAGGDWATVPVSPGTIAFSTIARSPTGDLFIAFASSTGELRLAAEADGWTSTLVATSVDDGIAAPLAVDDNGDLHLAFVVDNGFQRSLRHGLRHNGVWSIVEVDPATTFINYLTMAVDSANQPHLAYADTSKLHYATFTGGAWHATVLSGLGPTKPTIAVAPDGTRHLLYYAWGGAGWTVEHVVIESCWDE